MPAWIHSDPNADDGHWRGAPPTRDNPDTTNTIAGEPLPAPAVMPPTACPGGCNTAPRKAFDAYNAALDAYARALNTWHKTSQDDRGPQPEPPERPHPIITPGDPVWCRRCTSTIRHALVELSDLAAVLQQTTDGHRTRPTATSDGSKPTQAKSKAAAPSVSPTTDTLDELYGALTEVERQWREARGHAPRPDRSRTGDARNKAVAYLLDQLDLILGHPASIAFGRATLSWRNRLRHATKSEPLVRPRGGRCPRCHVRALRSRDDGYTECSSCGRLMTEDEYQAEAALQNLQEEAARHTGQQPQPA